MVLVLVLVVLVLMLATPDSGALPRPGSRLLSALTACPVVRLCACLSARRFALVTSGVVRPVGRSQKRTAVRLPYGTGKPANGGGKGRAHTCQGDGETDSRDVRGDGEGGGV